MTLEEIKAQAEGWSNNMGIFEIYDEVKEMGTIGYMGGNLAEQENLKRLLTHAYYHQNEHKMPKVIIDGINQGRVSMIKELAYTLGVEIMSEEEKEEDDKLMEKQEKEFDVELWKV